MIFVYVLSKRTYKSLKIGWSDKSCVEPNNVNFKTKAVFFGGSLEYDVSYWNDIRSLYRFSLKIMKTVEWDKDSLEIHCWW